MGSNSGGDYRWFAPVHSRSHADGVPTAGNCMTDTCPRLDGQDKSVTKGGRNRSACFQERLEVDFGGFLKAQDRLATVSTMGMTSGQQPRFRDPDTVRIATHLNLGKRDNHSDLRVYELGDRVNRAVPMPSNCPPALARQASRSSRPTGN